MKNTKMCPKCQSGDIVRIDGYTGPYGSGNNVKLGMTALSTANVNRYVCLSCGYSEEWIDKEELWQFKNSKKAKKI